MLVDPRLRLIREPVDVHLTKRDEHLALGAVDRVAVDVHVREVVVGSDTLQLLVRLLDDTGVPQAHVADGLSTRGNV